MNKNIPKISEKMSSVNIQTWDFFDKIINIKFGFVNKEKGVSTEDSTYILRSDYEIMPNGVVRRCVYKPSIKVSYFSFSKQAQLQLIIEIDNFYMIDSSGNRITDFNRKGFRLDYILLQVGYGANFYQTITPTAMELFEMRQPFGVSTIKATVVAVYPKDVPPKYTLVFDCLIGGYASQTPYKLKALESSSSISYETISTTPDIPYLKATSLQDILFQTITRRFLANPLGSYDIATQMLILADLKSIGILSEPLARKVGLKCYFPDAFATILAQNLKPNSKGVLNAANTILFTESGKVVAGVINNINNLLGSNLTFVPLIDGSIVVFPIDTWVWERFFPEIPKGDREGYINGMMSTMIKVLGLTIANKAMTDNPVESIAYDNYLPAVYSISNGVKPTIKSPFFYWTKTFSEVKFNNPYSTGNLLAYLTSTINEVKMNVLSQKVNFATIEDVNEVEIQGVIS